MRVVPESHRTAQPEGGRAAPVHGTDYLQLRDYLAILLRRRWIIIGLMAAGLAGGVAYNWFTTPLYEARATLQIEADPNILALDRPLIDQRDWMREFLPTQLGILTSRDLARMAHEELQRAASSGGDDQSRPPVPSVGEIMAGRRVDPIRDTRLVNVGFRSTDPRVAAQVANVLASTYVQRNLQSRTRTRGEASDWLTQQVEQQRKLVDASEAALQRYRQDNGADALFTDRVGAERQNIVVQKLGELQGAVTRARQETIEKEAQFKQLAAIEAAQQPLETLPAIAANGYIQGLKGELTALQRQLVQASKELGERHPDIIKLQGAIQNAERKLQAETANVVQAIRNDYQAAQSRERALSSALAQQKVEVQGLNSKTVEYTALEREAISNREVLGKLLQRSRETNLEKQLQSTNVAVVDSAVVPSRPVLPRKERTMMLALVGSGLLGLGLIFVIEIFNTRMTSPADVKQHLRLPVLGVAPEIKMPKGQRSLLFGEGLSSQFTELLHGLRTNLVLAPEFATTRTLMVTSSEPGEGKTLTAANLAASLARLNQRVLLIDADLRKPELHELFGATQQPGLTDVLAGTATSNTFRKTAVPRLWLMPSGAASRNPADVLGSERFRKLIDMLGRQFDWVVIDSPPVLAVTDPCLIGRVVSGVLFVVGCGQTSREAAAAAVERLDTAGSNLLGAVLNRVVLDKPGESYLPYYHREYETYVPKEDGLGWRPEVPELPSKGESHRAPLPLAH
jgi:capsular exopolysaccharide synthesis family protein